MLSQGTRAPMNYAIFSNPLWARLPGALALAQGKVIEGINLDYARAVSEAIGKIDPDIKVLCTGGFQHADRIAEAIRSKACDGVTMARPLIANNDLPKILAEANGPREGMHLLQQVSAQRSRKPARLLRPQPTGRNELRGSLRQDDQAGHVGLRAADLPLTRAITRAFGVDL